jgi:hypothetical protein
MGSRQAYLHPFLLCVLCVLCVERLGNCSAFNPFGALGGWCFLWSDLRAREARRWAPLSERAT